MSKFRILFVDDDDDFRSPIARLLKNEGFVVDELSSAAGLETVLEDRPPDLLLMDIMMPGENGLDAMRKIDGARRFPAILLSARSDVEHRIEGIQTGADYYLCKPVSAKELIAVIRNLLERYADEEPDMNDDWIFEAVKWLLISPDGRSVKLTTTEYCIVDALLSNPGHPVRRKNLLAAMGKPMANPDDQSLNVLISRLRSKFDAHGLRFPIKAVRGAGYVFAETVTTRGLVLPEIRKMQSN